MVHRPETTTLAISSSAAMSALRTVSESEAEVITRQAEIGRQIGTFGRMSVQFEALAYLQRAAADTREQKAMAGVARAIQLYGQMQLGVLGNAARGGLALST
jgi:hypothetical protein